MSKHLTLQSDSDAINEYLMGRSTGRAVTLSEALQEKLRRLERVADWLAVHKAQRIVVGKILQAWDDVSEPTAYRYLNEAQDVFKPQSRYDRAFYVDTLIADVAATYAMAKAQQNTKVMATCQKQMAEIIEKFMGTNEAMPIDQIQPPRLVLSNAHELAGAPLPKGWEQQLARIRQRRTEAQGIAYTAYEEVDETQKLPAATGS